jgi:hypothetical protein
MIPIYAISKKVLLLSILLLFNAAFTSINLVAQNCDLQLQPDLPELPGEVLIGSRMQRTVTLLSTSTPEEKHPVKILVYGQSISAGLKNSCLEDAIKTRFPYAEITFENRSISGFSANQLVRSAVHDVYPAYPDLVIFHVYGVNSPEYERIIYNIRKYTTADILLWTDHRGNAGEKGSPENLERIQREDQDSQHIRYLAQKYNCELADVRTAWNLYLEKYSLEPNHFLKDQVHLNEAGNQLLTAILLKHFKFQPHLPNNWMQMVKSYEAKRMADEGNDSQLEFPGKIWKFKQNAALGTDPESPLRLKFTGNRVDLVPGSSLGEKTGSASILIDNKKPSEFKELIVFTLPSPAFGAEYQPAIRRISHHTRLIPEKWSLMITKINPDRSFEFEVEGSVTGPDGKGKYDPKDFIVEKYGNVVTVQPCETSQISFISNSGRVVIDYRDFKINWAKERTDQPFPEDFEVTWEAIAMYKDQIKPEQLSNGEPVTIFQGIPNGEHILEIIPDGNGVVPIEKIVVYSPPLP